jgi:hypothetical protein
VRLIDWIIILGYNDQSWRLHGGPWQADGSIREWSRIHVKTNIFEVVFVEDNTSDIWVSNKAAEGVG